MEPADAGGPALGGSIETGPPPDLSPGRGDIAGANFFDPATYPTLS